MPTFTEALLTGGLGFILYRWYSFHSTKSKIRQIPTVGSDGFILAYLSAWRYMFHGEDVLKEGYAKYPGSVFKFPTLNSSTGWMIIVNSEKLIEELRKAPSDVLSFHDSAADSLRTEELVGPRHSSVPEFHVGVIRNPLTRALTDRFPDIKDEVFEACSEYLPSGSDWEPVKFYEQCIHIVCRTSNRLFIGLPLCRDLEYCKIQESWTVGFIVGGHLIHLAPSFLRPLVSYLVSSKLHSSTKKVEAFLRPTIEKRLEKDAKLGSSWEGKPNDLITWLIDSAPEGYRTVEDITGRIMLVNFGAVHTSSLSLTNTLFDLAARPEYIKPLRDEVEEVTREFGWTKEAMNQLRKLDSFMKESSRLSSVIATSVQRKAVKDFTLSDGTVIPAGFTVGAASQPIHSDSDIYEDAMSFNGFRFSDRQTENATQSDFAKNQMVSIDSSYLFFGLGRNSCPGRHFAVNEVKLAMSYILLNYDIKLPGDSKEVPPGIYFTGSRAPDRSAQVLFKKRKAAEAA